VLKNKSWGLGVAGAAVVAIVVGVSAVRKIDHVVFVERKSAPAWTERIARVDEAIGRSDLGRAIYEWREAYGAANRSTSSESLIAAGDRAMRLAELTIGVSYFRNEARHLYGQAAFRARTEGSREAILRIADALDRLGDTRRASQVRRMLLEHDATRTAAQR
jgi:hypothetical protein